MAQTATWTTTYRVPESLPNDTEESVVGTEWHQEAIGALADMLRDVAERRGATWGVCEQIALLGLQYEDGKPYNPRPDVMVIAQPLPGGHISAIPLSEAGVPLFIAEVASDSTVGNDVGAKRLAYAAIGVPEYVVFDPVGNVLSTPLLAWRLEAGGSVSWRPDADGSWRSGTLDVAFQATQPFLGVRDRDGTQIEPSREVRRRARQLEQRLHEVEERVAAAEQARADLEEQLRRLREEH
jgi:Uma2 family endonuclease